VFILILITLALWWLVYRRAWTVRVHAYHDYSQSPVKIGVRLPDEVTAYRAAAGAGRAGRTDSACSRQ
jgi:hypothetical protein